MSKFQSGLTLRENILELLKEGQKHVSDIREAFPNQAASVSNCMTSLRRAGETILVERGIYRLPTARDGQAVVDNSRGEAENTQTINKMLNVYDLLLDDIVVTLASELATKTTIEAKIDLLTSLRWVAATIDQLMKRWYLVHRGYDTNTKQAHEDAKHKAAEREKQALEDAPPEAQVEVVMEYDESMREILAKMPKLVQEETPV